MRVEIRRFNDRGRPLPAAQFKKQPASSGNLRISDNRLHYLGRHVRCATLTHATDGLGTVLLPELIDAEVLRVEDNLMRVRGTEQVDGAYYAQTWDIKVL